AGRVSLPASDPRRRSGTGTCPGASWLPSPGRRWGNHRDDPLEVVDGSELDEDPALPPTDVDLDAGLKVVRESVRELAKSCRLRSRTFGGRLLRRGPGGERQRNGFLSGPDGEPLRDDPGGEQLLLLRPL